MPRKGRSEKLLKNSDVKRWFENLRRGSEQTARINLRLLERLCRYMNTTPQDIVKDHGKGNGFEDTFQDFLEGQRKKGRAPSYLNNYVKVARSWLQHNRLVMYRKVKVGKTQSTPTLEDEQIPTRQELRDILMAGSPRGRVSTSLVAFSGLRPRVLGNFKGMDGLRLKDLPELECDAGEVSFAQVPTLVRVRTNLSKVSYPYLTFLGQEGCDHLRRYLELRTAGGERLRPESPVIRCTPGWDTMGKREGARNRGSPFIVTTNIRGDVKAAMEKAGYDGRPYVLRRYFRTKLLDVSWKGLVPRDWVSFWAGRKGDIEFVYSLHKGLPSSLIEDMRKVYARASRYLETTGPVLPDSVIPTHTFDKLKEEIKRQESVGTIEPDLANLLEDLLAAVGR